MKIRTGYLGLLGALLLGKSLQASAQDCVLPVEQLPRLRSGPGGATIAAAVQQRLVYPPQAKRDRVEGRVFVECTVTAGGIVESVHVVKKWRPDCDAAAVHAVRKLPRLIPSQQLGKPVACSLTIPVVFKLPALPGAL